MAGPATAEDWWGGALLPPGSPTRAVATPLSSARPAPTPADRRLSATYQPESHPVSPSGSSEGRGPSKESSFSLVGFGLSPSRHRRSRSRSPAKRTAGAAPAPPPAPASRSPLKLPFETGAGLMPPAECLLTPVPAGGSVFHIPAFREQQEERVTLNIWVADASATAAAEAAALQHELAGMRSCVGLLQGQLADTQAREAEAAAQRDAACQQAASAQAEAAAAAAAAASQQVAVVFNVVEAPPPPEQPVILALKLTDPSSAQPLEPAAPAHQPVTLVLNISEAVQAAAAAPQAAAEPAAAAADPGVNPQVAALAAQLARAEALREELARHQGQLRGKVCKLEGALLAGEGRVKAQVVEIEALRAAQRIAEQQLAAAQAQLAVTPDRLRAVRRQLQEDAEQAQRAAEESAARAQQLQAVVSYDACDREGLAEFTALEYQLLQGAEGTLGAEAAAARAAAGAASREVGEVRQRLVAADAALLQQDEQVRQLRQDLAEAKSTAEEAAAAAGQWRAQAKAYDQDRHAAAANVRKAEREVDLIAAENEVMFRQLNYVRARLVGQLTNLDLAVPEIGKLARELQAWCDREAAQRVRQGGPTPAKMRP